MQPFRIAASLLWLILGCSIATQMSVTVAASQARSIILQAQIGASRAIHPQILILPGISHVEPDVEAGIVAGLPRASARGDASKKYPAAPFFDDEINKQLDVQCRAAAELRSHATSPDADRVAEYAVAETIVKALNNLPSPRRRTCDLTTVAALLRLCAIRHLDFRRPATPYRGRLSLERALFAVKAADLYREYIELLGSPSSQTGSAVLSTMLPFAEPLRHGIDLLFGNSSHTILEIGIDRIWTTKLHPGSWVLMWAGPSDVDVSKLSLDSETGRLLDDTGQSFDGQPYIVFPIEATRERPDWMLLAPIEAAWDSIGDASKQNRLNDAEQLLRQFALLTHWSPDLVPTDADGLAAKALTMNPKLPLRQAISAKKRSISCRHVDRFGSCALFDICSNHPHEARFAGRSRPVCDEQMSARS